MINNVLCPFHWSQHSDSNDSGHFMDIALLRSYNDALINNVMYHGQILSSLLYSMLFFVPT